MPAPVTPTPIVAYSGSLPDPSDPSTYGTRGRALWAWEVGALFNGINLIASQTFTNAEAAAESAESATMTAGAAMWSAATNYATGQNAISPTDLQTYRRNSPGGVNATDPAASALWTLVGDKFLRKAGDTVTGNLQLSANAGYITASANMSGHPSHTSALAQHTPILRNLTTNAGTLVGAVANGSGAIAGYYAKLDTAVSDRWGGLTVENGAIRIHSSASNNAVTAASINFTFKGVDLAGVANNGVINCYGIRGREGTAGLALGNAVNLFWTGSALQAWIDTTNQGTVTLTSDYRIKRDIRPLSQSALPRIAALRPVLYRYADNEQFNHKAEDREREGFIAHELAEVIPSAVEGEKDAPNQIQSLRVDALLAVLVKALQEQQAQIEELQAQVFG